MSSVSELRDRTTVSTLHMTMWEECIVDMWSDGGFVLVEVFCRTLVLLLSVKILFVSVEMTRPTNA
jgi:hypothetical protein